MNTTEQIHQEDLQRLKYLLGRSAVLDVHATDSSDKEFCGNSEEGRRSRRKESKA